jgi:hypothetical protein
MRRLLLLLLLAAATSLRAAPYRNDRCGVAFDLPQGWVVGQWGDDGWKHRLQKKDIRCDLGIRPKGWAERAEKSDGFLMPYAIEILVVDQPFRKVARFGGFMQVREFPHGNDDLPGRLGRLAPDDWTISEREGDERAEQFHTACCQGVRGTSWFRIWNAKHEVGTGTSDVVVLNDRKLHSVYIATQVSEEFTSELNRIVDTFRFNR